MPEKECNKCRTCFNKSIRLHSLSMVVADEPKEQMTYGDMLKEVTNINVSEPIVIEIVSIKVSFSPSLQVMEDESSEMPQYICYDCLCKLKSSHSFIKQAQDSNEKFISLLNNRDELSIDIQPCLGIKVECSDQPFCNYETSGSEHNLDLKREIIDENPLDESMCNYKTLPGECSNQK